MASPPVVPNPSEIGVDAHDASGISAHAGQFKGQGDSFVAQYIDQSPDASMGGSPSLTTAQVQQDAAAGLSIVSIFQTNGMSGAGGSTAYQTYFTHQQGAMDGTEALESAEALGQPPGSTIYFAFDFDPAAVAAGQTETQLLTSVQTYLTVVSQVLANSDYKIGVYGAGDTLAAVIRNTIGTKGYTPVATQGWLAQSYGWAGSGAGDTNAAGWAIYQQYTNPNDPNSNGSTTQNGVAVDDDDATTNALGQWTCFATGTLIRTAYGDVAVEALAVGDLVATASGAHRPIRWIGKRALSCAGHPHARKIWPYRVAAGTLGADLPEGDLWLSPEHALCLDDVLIPVRALAQPGLVEQVEVDEITYWHVELDSHDILLANGTPVESYLDTGNRGFFDADGPAELKPLSTASFCRPFVESGAALSRVRARLFGPKPATTPVGMHLVADGGVLRPHLAGNTATFVVPAMTRDLRLCSPSFSPVGPDVRTLGVLVSALTVDIGDGERTVSLDDPALFAGFHDLERSASATWRWTDGDGHIASDLWAGAVGGVLVRVTGMFEPACVTRSESLAA